MNKVILMGRLTTTPELKTTQSGLAVTSFSIAVDRGYAKQGEDKQTDFFNIVCWRQRAEFVCKYFTKGQLIALDGSLQTRQYQDNNGNTRYVTEVVADNVYFTGDKRNAEQQPNQQQQYQPQPQPQYQQAQQPQYQQQSINMLVDDDLPF